MGVEITVRHVEVTDSVRAYARKRLDKLLAEFQQVDNVHMILDVQKYLHLAEIVVHAKRHIRLDARESTENMYASIDSVVDKIETQLRRSVDKRHQRKGGEKLAELEREQQSTEENE